MFAPERLIFSSEDFLTNPNMVKRAATLETIMSRKKPPESSASVDLRSGGLRQRKVARQSVMKGARRSSRISQETVIKSSKLSEAHRDIRNLLCIAKYVFGK